MYGSFMAYPHTASSLVASLEALVQSLKCVAPSLTRSTYELVTIELHKPGSRTDYTNLIFSFRHDVYKMFAEHPNRLGEWNAS